MKPDFQKAVDALKKDGVVAFPTETVYGLGARLFSPEGIRKIYRVKGRPADNPLIVHISDLRQLELLAEDISEPAKKLIRKFWPGPLTFVFKKTRLVPKTVTAGLETVAIRMPRHPVARKLIEAVGEPIAAPSANRSGRPSGTQFEDVLKELKGRADFLLSGGAAQLGLESTVLDVTRIPFQILRPGSITLEQLRKIFPKVQVHSKVHGKISRKGAAPSPGMKHRHYQPACKVVLVDTVQWKESLARWIKTKQMIGTLSFSRSAAAKSSNLVYAKSFSNENDYARSLYHSFFEAERKCVDVLLIETRPEKGLGLAIMDRLKRAGA